MDLCVSNVIEWAEGDIQTCIGAFARARKNGRGDGVSFEFLLELNEWMNEWKKLSIRSL